MDKLLKITVVVACAAWLTALGVSASAQERLDRVVNASEVREMVGKDTVHLDAKGLTIEAASVLAGMGGELVLELDILTDDVAKALAGHRGDLSITVRNEPSDLACKVISDHDGPLVFKTPTKENVTVVVVGGRRSDEPAPQEEPAEIRDPELTDVPSLAVVASVLGSESKAYDRHGYKDVVLGETLEQVTAKLPLPFNQDARSWIYSPDQSGQRQFIFDQGGVLRCYVHQYDGGTTDYLEQIKELFGKTEKPVKEEQLHNSKAGVHGTSIDYTFPHTLVRVTFEQHVLAGGLEFEKTYITVLDRAWAQELLIRDIARKRSVVRLLKEALMLAREQDFDESKSPKIEGLVAVRNGDAVQWQLPASAESAATGGGSEAGDTSRICGQYGMLMDEYDLKPTVVFDFSKYTAVQKPPTLLVPDRAHNRSVDALAEAPFLWYLRLDCVSALAQALFTPQDGRVDFLQPRKPFLPRFFEWHYIDDQGNRWLVRVFSDGRVAAVLQSSKKKL